MASINDTSWLDGDFIEKTLRETKADASRVKEVLAKARELKGLSYDEVATLTAINDPEQMTALFETAAYVKEQIYGKRMVLFAPLYISNLCGNECLYCAFRASNKSIKRIALTLDEIKEETRTLVRQGHKRILLVAGEGYPASQGRFRYILDSIEAVYSITEANGHIRRLNVNVAPLDLDEFKALKQTGIGTYQLFQETYHRPTYAKMHIKGKKADFNYRVSAMDRAMLAQIDDVGLGVLFGLYDWRFEVLAMMQHNLHLEQAFGVGCHTMSVPRIEPADNSPLSLHPPYEVSDNDFMKLIAILRVAVPSTGIILSTRETPKMRQMACALGVSQISAGSRTAPGGYNEVAKNEQFQLGDSRSLDEVVLELAQNGYIPSFCTACYRLGRTGADFMDLAKVGMIRKKCDPNGMSTCMEYLIDYASESTRQAGEQVIMNELQRMAEKPRAQAEKMIRHVKNGKRDIYC